VVELPLLRLQVEEEIRRKKKKEKKE